MVFTENSKPGNPRELLRACRGVAENETIDLLVVGMLNEAKGQFQFVKHCSAWLAKHPNYRIILCGRGDRIKKQIEQHSGQKKLKQQIVFRGFRDRAGLFAEYRKAKLVLLPTLWKEPFGRIPLEAGMARRAVVAFAVGGLNESIIDGKTGLLVEPKQYDGFTEKVDYLIAADPVRRQMEEAAFRHISANYVHNQLAQVISRHMGTSDERAYDGKLPR